MESTKNVGYYCWAGPGTIRMIKEKFFNPKINESDLMNSYSYDYLAQIKDVFNVTDFWATYSWGFNESVEQEDYDFFLQNLKNFQKAGIKVHAYIQGPNVVYNNFKNKDWYAKDHKNRDIAYYRGRKVTCLNNSEFQNHILQKIHSLKDTGIDGIYIDNIQNGQMGIPLTHNGLPFVFSGCNCVTCQSKFKQFSGKSIPTDFEQDVEITKSFLDFRVKSTTAFVKILANAAHENNLQFGTNSFDPKYNTQTVFGTELSSLQEIQDYLLFETHALRDATSIEKITSVADASQKPTFVISYKHGIGYDPELTQEDVNHIYAVAEEHKFSPALKGSEFTTKNIWHNLDPRKFKTPQVVKRVGTAIKNQIVKKTLTEVNSKIMRNFLKETVNPAYTLFMENGFIRNSFGWAYRSFI